MMSSQLMPSQAIQAQSNAPTTAAGRDGGGAGGRGPRRRRKRNNGARSAAGGAGNGNPNPNIAAVTMGEESSPPARPKQKNQSGRNGPADEEESKPRPATATATAGTSNRTRGTGATQNNKDRNATSTNQPARNKNGPAKKRRNRQKAAVAAAPWKKLLPDESVDPITLDPLESLNYPPFALVAELPYLPVDWPMSSKSSEDKEAPNRNTETEEQRQARILHEQWGVLKTIEGNHASSQPSSTENGNHPSAAAANAAANNNNKDRHVNLFDGRALAYYMVSQLQFIDPLNRRDLTRDEIVHLDQYLRRHKFFDLNVTEAYDAKGITISTAGAAAQTANGRATILQEEARHLLHALFGSRHHPPPVPVATTTTMPAATTTTTTTNSWAREYQEHEAATAAARAQQQQRQRTPPRSSSRPVVRAPAAVEDTGVYGAGTNYVVIDDDINPGLRVGDSHYLHRANYYNSDSGLRVTAESFSPRHAREAQFPPLAAATTTTTTMAARTDSSLVEAVDAKRPTATNLPKTKTLSKIGSLVQKTDPEEQLRQWEAREAAIRKAALVNRSFSNVNPVGMAAAAAAATPSMMPSALSSTTPTTVSEPTDGQIQRNMAFAEALGVQPATSRANLRAGWTRPSDGTDAFGNELAVTIYPQSLVLAARSLKPGVLTKIERKFRLFLADDTSASLSLTPMDGPTRKTVHEYAEFWKLQTESFDPEPKRYIHCVKLLDTRAPTPLLSEILYLPQQQQQQSTVDKVSLVPTTGPLSAREMPLPPIRTPLALQPRSDEGKTTVALSGMTLNGLPNLSMGDRTVAPRFEALLDGRERPKLELAKRTLPLDLPAFQAKKDDDNDEMIERLREKARRDKIQKEKMQQRAKMVIESAFASDDEDEVGYEDDEESTSSEWEEQTPVFVATDEDA